MCTEIQTDAKNPLRVIIDVPSLNTWHQKSAEIIAFGNAHMLEKDTDSEKHLNQLASKLSIVSDLQNFIIRHLVI